MPSKPSKDGPTPVTPTPVTGPRLRKPSQRVRDAADAAEAISPVVKPAQAKKGKNKGKTVARTKAGKSNNENENAPATLDHGEFKVTTLATNRTNSRAINAIRLNANVDGIPQPQKAVREPARIVAGQRQTVSMPHATPQRLSGSSAAHLKAMRNPFVPPHATAHDSGTGSPQTAAGPSSASQARRTVDNMRKRPGLSSAPQANNITDLPAPSDLRGTVPPAAQTPQVQSQQRGLSPFEHVMQDEPAGNVEPEQPDAHAGPQFIALQGISRTALGREWGRLPTVRRSHTIVQSDDDNDDLAEDYASHPRARAIAQAYDASHDMSHEQVNTSLFDPEDLDEIEDDPEAALDDDLIDQHVRSSPPHVPVSPRPGSVRTRADADATSDEDEQPRQRRRLASETPTDDSDADMAEPEFNSNVVPRKTTLRGDYVRAAQEVLDRAVTLYKTQVTSNLAYPDKLQERSWAKTAWKQAARELKIPLRYHSSIIHLITRYSWNLRSELKTAARNAVQGAYGFRPGSPDDLEWVEFNKARAAALLTNNAFVYVDPNTDKGMYQVYIIQAVINRVYYKSPEDDGVVHDDVYRPFPLQGVALVLTAIQCAIQEWETGLFSNVNFDQNGWSRVYDKHVADLRKFQYKGREHKVFEQIVTKISERGRAHAKAPVTQYTTLGCVSEEQMDRAIAAYLADN